MSIEIRMPRLVDTMTQGAVVAWRKNEGESVQAGEVIAEVEVDKATVDLEAPEAGILARIVVPAGSEKVEVGEVLAVLDKSGGPALAATREPAAAAVAAPIRENGHPSQPAQSAPALSGASIAPLPLPIARDEIEASPLARSMAL